VLLRIAHRGDKHLQYLVETKEQTRDGQCTEELRLPGCKLTPCDTKRTCAERMIFGKLQMTDCEVLFEHDDQEVIEVEQEDAGYPGITTICRKHFIDGVVTTADERVLQRVGFSKHSGAAQSGVEWKVVDFCDVTRSFTWLSEKEARLRHVVLSAPPDAASECQSGLVDPPIGMSERALWTYLEKQDIDVGRYGAKGAKTVLELANELCRGDCTLAVEPDGGLCRVVEQVQLSLRNVAAKLTLVAIEEKHADGKVVPVLGLPCGRQRPTDNHFCAVKNLLRNHLKIGSDGAHLKSTEVKVFECREDANHNPWSVGVPKSGYPGLETVRRTHVVQAELAKSVNSFMETTKTAHTGRRSSVSHRQTVIHIAH